MGSRNHTWKKITVKPPPEIVQAFCSPWMPPASPSCSGRGSHYMAFFAMKLKLLNYKLLSKQWLAPCIFVKVTGDVSGFPGNAFRKTSIDSDLHTDLLFPAKISRGWSLCFQTMLMPNNPVAPIRQGTWQKRFGEDRDISFDGENNVRKFYYSGCLIWFSSSWFHLTPRPYSGVRLG